MSLPSLTLDQLQPCSSLDTDKYSPSPSQHTCFTSWVSSRSPPPRVRWSTRLGWFIGPVPLVATSCLAPSPTPTVPMMVQVISTGNAYLALFIVALVVVLASLGLLASCTRSRIMFMVFLVAFSVTQALVTPLVVRGINVLQAAVEDVDLSIFASDILVDITLGLWLLVLSVLGYCIASLRWVVALVQLSVELVSMVMYDRFGVFLSHVALGTGILRKTTLKDPTMRPLAIVIFYMHMRRVLALMCIVWVTVYWKDDMYRFLGKWGRKGFAGVLHAMHDVRRAPYYVLRCPNRNRIIVSLFRMPSWVVGRRALEVVVYAPTSNKLDDSGGD
ncbi:hypothetical protein B0H21DRAFT_821139 [Amylocystis lapponica]|nr:hypothetical protein B0H21DRAFT_821139 [Amylocystis lapponica]